MMKPLDKTLRNLLERTIKQARDIAESGAAAALGQLGVGEAAAFGHLSEDEKSRCRRLSEKVLATRSKTFIVSARW